MMSNPDDHLDGLLEQWVRDAGVPHVPPDPSFRVRLREMIVARTNPSVPQAKGTLRPWARRRTVICVCGLAAVTLLGVLLALIGSEPSWAQVVATVRAKPWIHATARVPDKGSGEFWFSSELEVAASRFGEQADYANYRENVRYSYDPQTKAVVRAKTQGDKNQLRSFLEVFEAIFRGDATLKNPLTGGQLVDQKRRNVRDAGRSWTEYQLDLRADWGETQLTFRVDPKTRLPDSMTVTSTCRDEVARAASMDAVFTFDYPEQGPADIYALGVPRLARIVDRMPQGELARLLDGIKASRDGFPRTYVVVFTRGNPHVLPQFIWRKGDKWRREYRIPEAPEVRKALTEIKPPPVGPEAAAWWIEKTKSWRPNPMEICDGTTVYGDMTKTEKPQWSKIRSGPGLSPISHYLPEQVGYVLPRQTSESSSLELDMHPKYGPPGTVLIISRSTADTATHKNGQAFLCWVDPGKSYLVMRYQWVDPGWKPDGPEPPGPRYVVDGVAQAPNGICYPITVRQEDSTAADGKGKVDETWTYSLDFKTDVPDHLFRVESAK
jgi:hypothetical protein